MGKVIFRKIGGRLVPIGVKQGNLAKILPKTVRDAAQATVDYRKAFRGTPAETKLGNFIRMVEKDVAKRNGQFAGKAIAKAIRALKGKK